MTELICTVTSILFDRSIGYFTESIRILLNKNKYFVILQKPMTLFSCVKNIIDNSTMYRPDRYNASRLSILSRLALYVTAEYTDLRF